MTARFDDSGPAWTGFPGGLVEHTGSGFAFHVWPLPTAGDQFWRVDGDGFTWRSIDDFYDGWNGGVIRMDADYHLTGFSGAYLRSFSSTVPVLRLQDDDFTISGGVGDYGNTSDPGFWRGTWDLASATVKVDGVLVPQGPIPEPGTWAMMLLGFPRYRRGRAWPWGELRTDYRRLGPGPPHRWDQRPGRPFQNSCI